jgi:NADPH:quinone reductase-like Zn-dependent oxidoreductase
MNDNRAVAGVNMGHLWNEMDMLTAELKALLELHGKRAVRPHVDSVFRFEQAGEAHRRIQSRQNVGKVVLVP